MSGEPLFDWLKERGAGVLLHPTSLPGDQGIGTLGAESQRLLEFLQAAGFTYWQICPLGPTGYGDSPYQCFSAFAGNPYLIDLNQLVERGFLKSEELNGIRQLAADHVDYGGLWNHKWKLLEIAAERFAAAGRPAWDGKAYDEFLAQQADWLDAYALFMALKRHHGGKSWTEWPTDQRTFASASKQRDLRQQVAKAVDAERFYQYVFFAQWRAIRAAAEERGIQIIGDMPIFVAADSADVWAHPELFDLDAKTGKPRTVAGVPPDYFSADGQLWGNPLYVWNRHKESGYAWWHQRIAASFELYDVLRIDHFRGFDEYWQVPQPAENARGGKWMPGPRMELFRSLKERFPDAQIIAEDLGVLTPGVIALREGSGLPGMAVLQFAFGGKPDNLYLPHNLEKNCVVYAGTHDNDTTRGWYAAADDHIKDHVRRYFRIGGQEIGWDFIRAAYASVPNLAVVTLQDLLDLGSEARINTPGKPQGNWGWRCSNDQLERLFGGTAKYLQQLGELYGRLPVVEEEDEGKASKAK